MQGWGTEPYETLFESREATRALSKALGKARGKALAFCVLPLVNQCANFWALIP